MNKLILCMFGLAILASSQVLGQGQEPIQCVDAESFELAIGPTTSFEVFQLDVQINLLITIKEGFTVPVEVDQNEYAKACIQNLKFKISQNDDTLPTQEKKLPDTFELDKVSGFNLTGFEPLTAYGVTVSLTQANNNSYGSLLIGPVTTCFSSPTQPKNLKLDIKDDGSGVLTWEAPETLNAPKICSYVVSKRKDSTVDQIASVDSTVLSQVITKEDIESSGFLQVKAVNDKSCYGEPATQCASPLQSSFNEIEIPKPNPSTTEEPNSSTRPSLSFSVFFLLPLLALIY